MPPVPPGKVLLLLAEDLRLEDNLAFALASDRARDGIAVVRILPEARGRPLRTRHRREIEDAAERRIREQLSGQGIPFEVLGPEHDTSLALACGRTECTSVIRNAADGMALETAYRVEWERELEAADIPILTVNGETIRRLGPGGAKPGAGGTGRAWYRQDRTAGLRGRDRARLPGSPR